MAAYAYRKPIARPMRNVTFAHQTARAAMEQERRWLVDKTAEYEQWMERARQMEEAARKITQRIEEQKYAPLRREVDDLRRQVEALASQAKAQSIWVRGPVIYERAAPRCKWHRAQPAAGAPTPGKPRHLFALSPHERAVYDMLGSGPLGQYELEQTTHLPDRTVRRAVRSLIDRDLIAREGAGTAHSPYSYVISQIAP